MHARRALIVSLLSLSVVLLPAGSASPRSATAGVLAQAGSPSIVAITKSVRGGTEFAPGEPFNFVLSYSCSASLDSPCVDMVITDSLPSTLSWARADVSVKGPPGTSYDPATGVATFAFGTVGSSSGVIEITVVFPPGTAPGTEAINTATITASNATPATSNPVRVTARARSSLTLAKRRVTGPAQLATPVTYRLAAALAAGGTQVYENARIVDDLPAGATFVEATNGGTYDPSTNQVTWQLGALVPDPNKAVTATRDVTVIFAVPGFAAGAKVVNSATLFATPQGGTEQAFGPAQDTATLRQAGAIVGVVTKNATSRQLGPGQSDVYTVAGSAPAGTDLTALTITDRLPVGLVAVQDGSPNLTGSGLTPAVIVDTAGGSQPVPVAVGGGGWSATVPASAGSFAVTFGPVSAGTAESFKLRAGIPDNGLGRDGLPVAAGSTIENCAVVSGQAPGTTVLPRTRCIQQQVVPIAVDFAKRLTSASTAVPPGGSASWALDLAVPTTSASPLVQPMVTDCLPSGFDLLDPANPATGTSTTDFVVAPIVQRALGGCGSGRVQVTWSWPGPFTLGQGQGGSIELTARVDAHAAPGLVTNEATLVADNLSNPEVRRVDMVVTSTTLLTGGALVRGSRDVAFVAVGTEGHTSAGGSATYAAEVENVSAVPATHLVLIDILPAPGDTGVRSNTPRLSGWRPLLSSGGSSSQAPVAVSYSASSNPCRPEVGFNDPSCEPPGWSVSPPGGQLAEVRSLRADFGGFVLAPGAKATFTWTMATPGDVVPGATAWNSFAFVADRADNGEALLPSEPAKVGLRVDGEAQLTLRIVKRVNGVAAPEPPGPFIPVGDPVVFTYEVTNTGTVPAFNISVSDDVLGQIPCPTTTLAPGASMVCTAPTQRAIVGQQTNIGIVLAAPTPEAIQEVLGESRAYNFGEDKTQPLIVLVKRINGQLARVPPGPNIPPGQPVSFTYTVANGGALPVSDITVVDDHVAGITCPKTSLAPHQHPVVCTAPVQTAVEGGQVNIATATAQPRNPRGNPTGPPVEATDRAYYTNTIAVAGSTITPIAALGGAMLTVGLGLIALSRRRAVTANP